MIISYYAGAADAAGVDSEVLDLPDVTAAELITALDARHEGLASVLRRCSLLVDGAPLTSDDAPIVAAARVDVLPPFAGG